MKPFLQFLAVAAFVGVADFIWLGIVMKSFYQTELHGLIRQGPKGFAPWLVPAFLVYVLIPTGIVFFVGPRIPSSNSLLVAAAWGAAFGLIVYGIYDLTNLSILDRWPIRITIVDIVWGMVLCAGSGVCLALVRRATG